MAILFNTSTHTDAQVVKRQTQANMGNMSCLSECRLILVVTRPVIHTDHHISEAYGAAENEGCSPHFNDNAFYQTQVEREKLCL